MKGFLPDGMFNPFDAIHPGDPGLADLALVSFLEQQNGQQQDSGNAPDGSAQPPRPPKFPWED